MSTWKRNERAQPDNCRQEPHKEERLRQADRRDPRSGRVAAKIRSRDATRIQDKVQDKDQDKDHDERLSADDASRIRGGHIETPFHSALGGAVASEGEGAGEGVSRTGQSCLRE